MPDRLVKLTELAKKRVEEGYYEKGTKARRRHASLVQAIANCDHIPLIAEIKYASPSQGKIRNNRRPREIAKKMLAGGACALSILTDPDSFNGGLHILTRVGSSVVAPLLMKDIIVSPRQVRAAANFGADAVVLISELFSEGLADEKITTILREARQLGLETLVEANTASEFEKLHSLHPDLFGINNRNLSTFEVDLDTTAKILGNAGRPEKPIVSESGIDSAAHIRRLKKDGVQAFLVGTSIMKSPNIEEKVRELVNA